MMALSPKALGRIFFGHMRNCCRPLFLLESAEGQCLLTIWCVEKNRWIPEQIGSPVDNNRCLQFLLRMAPQDDGNDIVLNLVGGGGGRIMEKSIHPSINSSPPALVFCFCFCADADRRWAQFLQRMAPLCDGIEVDSVVDFLG